MGDAASWAELLLGGTVGDPADPALPVFHVRSGKVTWVSEFNDRFAELSDDRRGERYRALAAAALERYALGKTTVAFVGHNGSVAYRVETPRTGERFLLKITEPVGEGGGGAPERFRSTLRWLAALARDTELVVQEPVPDLWGELLTAVPFDDLPTPFACSLQRWVAGEHIAGDFTPMHTYRIGALLATLHLHGSHWPPAATLAAHESDSAWATECECRLEQVVDLGILSPAEWRTVAVACRQIRLVLEAARRRPGSWGPIHGDPHHQNVLFCDDRARPIDFGAFTRAPLFYDLGVTWYHVMYQDDVSVRRALIDGYHRIRPEATLAPLEAEVYLCAAALGNLAFQVTLPSQRSSPGFSRNVREFATVFCRELVDGEPFVLAE